MSWLKVRETRRSVVASLLRTRVTVAEGGCYASAAVSVLPVEARHIEDWSKTKSAEGLLPRLVRRLILAMDWTARVDMPGGEGTRRHGADGRVESSRAVQFVPEGLSIWELSVESTEKKLNDDYDKRVTTALDEGPAGTVTYVAVSARSIPPARKKK